MSKIDRVIRVLSGAGAVVSGTLVAMASIVIFAYIINRSFIGQVWLFVEDWVGLSLVAISYLGMGYTLRHGRHISVDIAVKSLSPWRRNMVDSLVSAVAIIVLGYMMERSISWLVYMWGEKVLSSSAMLTPLWIPTVTMVLGMAILILEMVLHFVRTLMATVRRSGQTDGYLKISAYEKKIPKNQE